MSAAAFVICVGCGFVCGALLAPPFVERYGMAAGLLFMLAVAAVLAALSCAVSG